MIFLQGDEIINYCRYNTMGRKDATSVSLMLSVLENQTLLSSLRKMAKCGVDQSSGFF